MPTTNKKATWTAAYASVMGNGHIATNLPCQDSCEYRQPNDTWGIAVVCDGAGSAKQSDKGSDFVARNIAHCLEELLKQNKWDSLETMPTEEVWREEAVKALQLTRQRLGMYAENEGIPIGDLACTVLAVLYAPFGMLVTHIGDGRAAYSTAPSDWKALFEPFRGNEVNETVFITSNIWTVEGVEKYVDTSILQAEVRAFALLSDGCENGSFEVNVWDEANQKYHDPNRPFVRFFEPNVKGMLQLHAEQKTQEEINTIWAGFLKEGTKQFKHETDDKTMILVVKNPVAEPAE